MEALIQGFYGRSLVAIFQEGYPWGANSETGPKGRFHVFNGVGPTYWAEKF